MTVRGAESVNDNTHSPAELPPGAKLEKLNYYRSEDRHEWTLLSNRLSSYITSQSFLVTSYAIAMGNQNPKWSGYFTLLFPSLIAILGLATSWRACPGITGAIKIIALWHRKERRLFLLDPTAAGESPPRDPSMEDFDDGRPRTRSRLIGNDAIDDIHDRSLRFAVAAPWLFGTTWILLLALAVGLHFLT
jgi:hypothetical protein